MPLRTRWIAAGLLGVFTMDACFEIGACPYEEDPAQLRRTPDFAGLNALEIGMLCRRARRRSWCPAPWRTLFPTLP